MLSSKEIADFAHGYCCALPAITIHHLRQKWIRVSSCPTGQVCFSGREFLLKNNFQNAFAKRIGNNTNFSLSKKSAFIADFFDRLKGLCVLQSPFFNKINPLGICETALWTIKCLRMFIKRKTADLRNHLAQQLRVFQHGARAQVVLVERLAIVVRHEERRLQDFEQCFFANVEIGIVDEHARAARRRCRYTGIRRALCPA